MSFAVFARLAFAIIVLSMAVPASAGAATIVVNDVADNTVANDSCSLREAVTAVNTNADVNGADCDHDGGTGLDTISLAAGPYPIAVTSIEDNNVSGDFDVNLNGGDVVIDGLGQSQTTIDANDHDRVFEFSGTGSATVQELTATDGTAALVGGIIRGNANTNLTVARAGITNGVATGSGGGGGISFTGSGSLAVTDSLVANNQANGQASVETDNTGGGGILLLDGANADLTVTRSTVSGNSYIEPDDATNSTFHSGGGGIKVNSGGSTATITDSTIDGNSVTTADPADGIAGGGIQVVDAEDNLFVRRSAITNNTLSGGHSSYGAGIGWRHGSGAVTMQLESTTVSGNSATGAGVTEQGGGIGAFNGAIILSFTTVTNNTADTGRGIFFHGVGTSGSFSVRKSVVSETSNGCEDSVDDIQSLGNNVDRGATCHFTVGSDAENTNPNLAALADNGGPTLTHAIAAGSAAHDRVHPSACADLPGNSTTDQRGVPRPLLNGPDSCDSGAYELTECLNTTVNVVGTSGADNLVGTAGPDGVLAFEGDDLIEPGDGADKVCAGGGNDFILEAADGDNDQYDGDLGASDAVSLQDLPAAAYNVTVGTGTSLVSGPGVGTNIHSSIESAVGSVGNDTITAANENVANTMLGLGGDDTLEGRGGGDTLAGSSNGAAGDTVVFDEAPGSVSVDLSNAGPQATGDGTDTITTAENVIGASGSDTLTGNPDANLLSGFAGADTFEGRAGNDTLIGGNDADTVVFDEAPGPVTVDLSNAAAQNTGDGTDTITTTEHVTGSPFGDTLAGTNTFNNILSGLGGDDTLEGRAANDILNGGAHAAAGDTVVFDEAPGPVTVDLSTATAQLTGDGLDTITSTENVTGSPQADTLTGDGAANRLTGLGAGDTITGALGADQLFGNAGADNMFARDGIGDTVDCGTEADTVETDASPIDTLIDCETPIFPAVPAIPSVTPIATVPVATGERAAALKKCKKKRKKARKKCRKRAAKLPL